MYNQSSFLVQLSRLHSIYIYQAPSICWASLAQTVKNPPAVQETRIWSLGQEDPREKEMATHSSVLAWRIPWTEEPGGLQRAWHNWAINTFIFKYVLNPGDKNICSFKHERLKQAKFDLLWHSSILKL